jgi:hypothetical protein
VTDVGGDGHEALVGRLPGRRVERLHRHLHRLAALQQQLADGIRPRRIEHVLALEQRVVARQVEVADGRLARVRDVAARGLLDAADLEHAGDAVVVVAELGRLGRLAAQHECEHGREHGPGAEGRHRHGW